jgi:hypothetical protein
MDQVKVILAGLKKYHFWVVCGVVIVVGLVMWMTATDDLEARTKARASQIQKAKADVTGLGSKQRVNDKVITVDEQESDKVRDEAQKAWENLYIYQKEKNDWPAELGRDFHDMITTVEKEGPDAEIPRDYRGVYQNFIDNHFPKLYEIIDIRVEVQTDANGRIVKDAQGRPVKSDPLAKQASDSTGVVVSGGPNGEANRRVAAPKIGKVYWNLTDLRRVKGQFKEGATQTIDGDLQWDSLPSTRQIRLAQEDLWVYQALLRTIAATNGAQTYFHKMPIKRIDALEIAQPAATSFVAEENRLVNILAAGPAGANRNAPQGQKLASGPAGGSGPGGGHGNATGSTLTDYRYVNQVGRPLRSDEKPPFEEYNMMPIHMRLLMNQRKIPNLIANLANSSMPIEVRRVSIHPGEQGSAIDFSRFVSSKGPSGGPGPGMGPGGFPSKFTGGESPRFSSGGGSSSGSGMGGSADDQLTVDERDPLDLPVEIDGIIYIFNVPKREKLGTGTVAAAAASAPVPATGATPAAAAATPAAKTPAAAPANQAAKTPAANPATPATPANPAGKTPIAPAGVPAAKAPAAPGTPAAAPVPRPAVPGVAPGTPAASPSPSGRGSG